MNLKVNIYKDGQHWKTKKFNDPRTKFVRDFNSVNGKNSAVIARDSIERVQKSLWWSRYVLTPAIAGAVFLATLAGGERIFSGQKIPFSGGVSFFATTPDFEDPNKGDVIPIARSHNARGDVTITKDNAIILPQSDRSYILSWKGGFDQDYGPDDQILELGFRAMDVSGLKVDAVLSNYAEVRYKNSTFEYQRQSSHAIFDASDGPLTVHLEIILGAQDLDVSEGWLEISQSENPLPSS